MMTKIKFFTLIFVFASLASCKTNQLSQAPISEIGMYKISILYPNEKDKTFDMDYYENQHMPMLAGFLHKNLKYYEIEKGIAGRTPNDKVPFIAIGSFYCFDVDEYNKSIGQNIDAIISDIKNYTSIRPVIQISKINQLKYNKVR